VKHAARRTVLLILCLVFFGVVAVLLVMILREDRPDVEFLATTQAFKRPNALKRLALKVRNTIARRGGVVIRAEIVSTKGIESGKRLASVFGEAALGETNGILVWTLDQEDMNRLEKFLTDGVHKAELIANPRLVVSEYEEASMFAGSSLPVDGTNMNVGIDFRVLPRRKKNAMDLTLGYSSTELSSVKGTNFEWKATVVTNVIFAARVQIPKGKRLFVVSESQGKPPTCIFCRLISE
jgi:hypothetical protein